VHWGATADGLGRRGVWVLSMDGSHETRHALSLLAWTADTMGTMLPLVTWIWPETSIEIAVIVVLGVATHALISVGVSRATALALHRSAQHQAGRMSMASRMLGHATGLASVRADQRTRTLGSLLRSISGVVITVIVVLTIMSILGIPLTPLLASAGVGGIALAFGAQSLVKDYLTGIFMIMEISSASATSSRSVTSPARSRR